MNLISRAPNGRLDPFAACMLLWSEAVSVEAESITWNGHAHRVQNAIIHDDVISLYGISHGEVEAALPDMFDLLDTLGADEELQVDSGRVAEAVLEVVPTGRITGATIFLLQAGSHPLVAELLDARTIRVRYDERLAKGVPDLQGLLCGLLSRLRQFRGDSGPFTARFEMGAAKGRVRAIAPIDECVPGGVTRLDERVEVADVRVPEVSETGEQEVHEADSDEQDDLPAQLARALATTDELFSMTRRKVDQLEGMLRRLEATRPNPNDKRYERPTASSLGIPTRSRTVRSLALRSVLYFALGIACVVVGQRCFVGGPDLANAVAAAFRGVVSRAFDAVSLFTGNAQQLGNAVVPELPTEPLVRALRVIGIVLMALGTIYPVLKILRSKRRLDRELAHGQPHVSTLESIIDKSRLQAEAAYALELDAWASELNEASVTLEFEKRSLKRLEAACEKLAQNLAEHTQRNREADAVLVRSVAAESSAQQRHRRISEYCERVCAMCDGAHAQTT